MFSGFPQIAAAQYDDTPATLSGLFAGLGALRRGDRGQFVGALQYALNNFSRDNGLGWPVIDTDRSYGAQTEAAVRRFQVWAGLPATGQADDLTLSWFGLAGAVGDDSIITPSVNTGGSGGGTGGTGDVQGNINLTPGQVSSGGVINTIVTAWGKSIALPATAVLQVYAIGADGAEKIYNVSAAAGQKLVQALEATGARVTDLKPGGGLFAGIEKSLRDLAFAFGLGGTIAGAGLLAVGGVIAYVIIKK
jgi:peptidoglycan hydrolase-like protein with peptidoglycan-binding domain